MLAFKLDVAPRSLSYFDRRIIRIVGVMRKQHASTLSFALNMYRLADFVFHLMKSSDTLLSVAIGTHPQHPRGNSQHMRSEDKMFCPLSNLIPVSNRCPSSHLAFLAVSDGQFPFPVIIVLAFAAFPGLSSLLPLPSFVFLSRFLPIAPAARSAIFELFADFESKI